MFTHNKTATQGETWEASWEFKNSDGSTYSLAAYTEVHMQVRSKVGSTVVIEAWLTEGDFTKSGNVLSLSILVPISLKGNYRFDIDLIKANGDIWTPIGGVLNVREQITIQTA